MGLRAATAGGGAAEALPPSGQSNEVALRVHIVAAGPGSVAVRQTGAAGPSSQGGQGGQGPAGAPGAPAAAAGQAGAMGLAGQAGLTGPAGQAGGPAGQEGPTEPTGETPVPQTETAGVQSQAAVSPDRTSIRLQILPPLDQILPALSQTIPSTGGPAAATLAVGLAALGGLGVWLRHLGRRRR
jgi:hypothetical protein